MYSSCSMWQGIHFTIIQKDLVIFKGQMLSASLFFLAAEIQDTKGCRELIELAISNEELYEAKYN